MAAPLQVASVEQFLVGPDISDAAIRWPEWRDDFVTFIAASGVTAATQKRALLKHCGGRDLRRLLKRLPDAGTDGQFDRALAALNAFFKEKEGDEGVASTRFRRACIAEGESMDQYTQRLRDLIEWCDYPEEMHDRIIRDQILEKCNETLLVKFLSMKTKTLTKMLEVARAWETAGRAKQELKTGNTDTVNYVQRTGVRQMGYGESRNRNGGKECFRCGSTSHFARDCQVAMDKQCYKCGKIGHFARKCQSNRDNTVGATGGSQTSPQTGGRPGGNGERRRVRYTQEEHGVEAEEEKTYYVFSTSEVKRTWRLGTIAVRINDVPVDIVVDSGSSVNLIDSDGWKQLHQHVKLSPTTKQVYAYGSDKPLPLKGEFTATVSAVGSNTMLRDVSFQVVQGGGVCLLSKKTAVEMGVLRVGFDEHVYSTSGSHIADELQRTYADVFQGIGKLKDFQLKIHVDPDVRPVAQPVRRLPFALREKVGEKLDEWETLGIIEKVDGPTPWLSPLVAVPKPNGEIRLCTDMRQANRAIERQRYPIPTVDEILQDMNGSTVYSKLDLKEGFHQLELHEDSRYITAFVTHKGLYRFRRLNFGISAAPEVFQHVIQQVLADIDGVNNISDDMIIHGVDQKDHDQKLRAVIKRLHEKGLTVNLAKCRFSMSRVNFVGHVLSEKGLGVGADKVKAVTEARDPENVEEVVSFLALVNYCARFVRNLATLGEPLRKLTRKGVEWHWGPEQKETFREIKKRLSGAEVMAYYKPQAKTRLIVDASPVGLGAILTQEQADGSYRPISYASRTLRDVERRYSQTEKEALAIVWGCERFELYLYGKDFEVISDHKPLQMMFAPTSKPPARVERWALRLQPYKFTVVHVPGKEMPADVLSRLPMKLKEMGNLGEEYAYLMTMHAVPRAMTAKQIERESADDPDLERVREAIQTGNWLGCDPGYRNVKGELSVMGQVVLRGTRIVMPFKLRAETLRLAHEGHQGIVKTKARLRSKVWWPGIDHQTEKTVQSCHPCQLVIGTGRPEPVIRTTMPSHPWDHLALDLLELQPGEELVVLTDYHSRWFEVASLQKAHTANVTKCLDAIFESHGLPLSIRTDNGPQFVSGEFKDYMEERGIRHIKGIPYYPEANGEVERQNRSILKVVRAARAGGKNWKGEMKDFLLAYRSTPHSVTGVSPAELLNGRQMRTKLPGGRDFLERSMKEFSSATTGMDTNVKVQEARRKDAQMKQKGKGAADKSRHAKVSDLKCGEQVLLQKRRRNNKLDTLFEHTPYVVIHRKGNALKIKNAEGEKMVNIRHVKRFYGPTRHAADISVDHHDAIDADEEQPLAGQGQQRSRRERRRPRFMDDYVS